MNTHEHSKKTAKRARSVQKQVKTNKKKNKAALSDESNGGLFPAINLLHDPQGTVEKVFRRLRQSKQRFEVCARYSCIFFLRTSNLCVCVCVPSAVRLCSRILFFRGFLSLSGGCCCLLSFCGSSLLEDMRPVTAITHWIT